MAPEYSRLGLESPPAAADQLLGLARSWPLRPKAVANALYRLDVARLARIRFNLLAQVLDVCVDCALVAFEVVALYSVDQLEARVDAAWVLG